MTTVPANLIDKPQEGTRAVIVPQSTLNVPVFRGSGKTSYTCKICRFILVQNISHGQLRNIVIKCPKCGAYNEIP